MAINRFPCDKFASIELNQVEFPWQGMVVSQLPLNSSFTEAAPCENGMIVDADKANGVIKPVSATTTIYGIVYTSEKAYESDKAGLKNFYKVGGEYPRVGILSKGDTVTSNCFCYDTSEFDDDDEMLEACEDFATTPVYVVPTASSNAPKLTNTKPNSGIYGKVCKYYTMPNGEIGLKYQIVNM